MPSDPWAWKAIFVLEPNGETVFSGADIRSGQRLLEYGLMENGHAAYSGPDWTKAHSHLLDQDKDSRLNWQPVHLVPPFS